MRTRATGKPADEYFDTPPARPLLSDASVRWICGTAVLLAVVVLLAAAAWHRPDDAVRAVAVLWTDTKELLGFMAIVAVILFAFLALR
jgi:hypothetical protein